MQFFKNTFGGLILVFVLITVTLLVREPKLFTEPNTWLIGDTYDGFRTYAALVYHVKHDSTYMHYEGMNYPYGDKAAFTDNLPLVANSIKFISQNISDVSDYTGGILNLFLMLSVILCAVFIFLSRDYNAVSAVTSTIRTLRLSPSFCSTDDILAESFVS